MKEEISQQRCTVGAHGYTNNLPENQASKTNVDVIDKKVKRPSSRREKYVYLVDVSSFAQKVRKLLVDEAFSFSIKNSLQKIMKLLFKLGVWKEQHGSNILDHNNGELKQQRRRRQRERQKSNRFTLANQQICTCITLFVHFLAVVASLRLETS